MSEHIKLTKTDRAILARMAAGHPDKSIWRDLSNGARYVMAYLEDEGRQACTQYGQEAKELAAAFRRKARSLKHAPKGLYYIVYTELAFTASRRIGWKAFDTYRVAASVRGKMLKNYDYSNVSDVLSGVKS